MYSDKITLFQQCNQNMHNKMIEQSHYDINNVYIETTLKHILF